MLHAPQRSAEIMKGRSAMAKPPWAQAIQKNDPELFAQMNELVEYMRTNGALPAKFKTLMGLFGDAMLAHPRGVESLAGQARALGASEAEIGETIRMAFLWAGLPGLVVATNAYPEEDE